MAMGPQASASSSQDAGAEDYEGTRYRATGSVDSLASLETLKSKASSAKDHGSVGLMRLGFLASKNKRQLAGKLAHQELHWIETMEADMFFCGCIISHMFYLGAYVQLVLDSPSGQLEGMTYVVMTALQIGIAGVFTGELGLRLHSLFTCTPSFQPRVPIRVTHVRDVGFDCFLVFFAWYDILCSFLNIEFQGQLSLVLRALRLFRLVRIIRMLNVVPELKLLCAGLLSTFMAAGYAMVLLGFFAYIGALICLNFLNQDIPDLYGTIFLSMLTHVRLALVEAWPDISAPMIEVSWLWFIYCAIFLSITNIALLNVVTGVVCENVMQIAGLLSPPLLEEHEKSLHEFKLRLWEFFKVANVGEELEEDEYRRLLKSYQMRELLMEQGVALPLSEQGLLMVIDMEDKGRVSWAEWVDGILRQRGTRKDRMSQELQFDLYVANKMVARTISGTQKCTASAMKHSAASASHRLLEQLVRTLETVRAPGGAGPRLSLEAILEPGEAEVALPEPPHLDEACAELEGLLRSLSDAVEHAGALAARAEPPGPPSGPVPAFADAHRLAAATQTEEGVASGAEREGDLPAEAAEHADRRPVEAAEQAEQADAALEKPDGPAIDEPGGRSEGKAVAEARAALGAHLADAALDKPGGRSEAEAGAGACSSSASASPAGACSSSGSSSFRERSTCSSRSGSPAPLAESSAGPSDESSVAGVLNVRVLAAYKLPIPQEGPGQGSLNPYVVLRVGSAEFRTPTIWYHLSPLWHCDNGFSFHLEDRDSELQVEVVNAHLREDSLISKGAIALDGLKSATWVRRRVKLEGMAGEIELAASYLPRGRPEGAGDAAGAKAAGARRPLSLPPPPSLGGDGPREGRPSSSRGAWEPTTRRSDLGALPKPPGRAADAEVPLLRLPTQGCDAGAAALEPQKQ